MYYEPSLELKRLPRRPAGDCSKIRLLSGPRRVSVVPESVVEWSDAATWHRPKIESASSPLSCVVFFLGAPGCYRASSKTPSYKSSVSIVSNKVFN
jgi:hypothetical protein